MKKLNAFARTCLLLFLIMQAFPVISGTLVLNSGVDAPYFKADKQGFLDLIIPEVFRRLGIQAEALQYRSAVERAMINANTGIDDGVAMRIKGLERDYPNLVRVEEKIFDNEFVAFATRPNVTPANFTALKNYQVGHIIGWKIFETKLLPETSVTKVQGGEQLFSLLLNDRIDVALYERWQGNDLLARLRIKAKMLKPPLAVSEVYIYLHKKHTHLVEPAAKAIRSMKEDGTYQRIIKQSLTSYGQ